jgi:cell division protein FtsZ
MGDEVKITVIATGFKQQEMPQRRERMLAEATLPTMRYDVPIQPRVASVRPPVTRFASETETEPAAPTPDTEQRMAHPEASMPAELVPVPASVFDDDFFRANAREQRDRDAEAAASRFREPAHVSAPTRVQPEPVRSVAEENSVAETVGRPSSFAGTMAAMPEPGEPDELDIPAFLRRGN